MKRKFTKMTAALALLVGLMIPLGMWGQTRDTKTDIMFAKGFGEYTTNSYGATGTDYTAVPNSTNATGVTYAMQVFNGSTGAVRGNKSGANNFSCRNTTTYQGYYISSVSLTVSGGTLDGSTSGRSVVYFGTSAYANPNTTAPTGTATAASPNQSGQTTLTWTNTDENVTHFILYNLKTANTALSADANTPLTVVWTQKSGGGQTVAAPTFSLLSGETGTTLVNEDVVLLDCETDDATIYYTMGDDPADPTDASNEYDPDNGIEISATTTIKAIAYVGEDHSSVASKTYTILTMKTIAEAREQETGAVYTQGTVTSISGSSAFIQDVTAAINVYGDNSLEVGKKYNVVGTLTTYNGLMEITSPTCTEVAGGTVIEPEVMTIAQILESTNQGWFIKIEEATVGSTSNNNTTLTQNGSSIVARYLSGAEEGDVINLTGNISCYNTTKQIANPLVVVGPSIAVDETALSFTYIVGGSAEAQTIAITGTNTTEAIIATVAEGDSYFSISDDEVNWSSTLQLPAAGDAIVVRLNPGLTNGTFDGTITLTSAGAQTVTVTLTGIVTNQTYAINLNQTAGGSITADKATAEAGQTVTLTATPDTGYEFGSWTVLDGQAQTVTVTNNQFTMPASAVEVEGSFSQVDYTITVAETTNGTVECEYQTAHYGDEIWVTVTPAEGYRVASFTVTENGGEGTVTDIENADDIYSFSMPAYNVTITVVFEVIPDVYGGEGIFNKVTSLDDLEDGGYYVLVNSDYAMNSTNNNGKMSGTAVTITANAIINPSTTIVWKLEKNGENWNIYNEEIGKYCYIQGNSSSSFKTEDASVTSYVVTYSNGFYFKSTDSNGRFIAYYESNHDFRTYASGSALTLYKLSEASQDPFITVSPDAVTVPGEGGNGTLTITYNHLNISGSTAFTIQYYDEDDELVSAPAWMNNVAVAAVADGYVVNYTIAQNDDADREARFMLFVGDVSSNLVTFTQSKYVAPVTYTLATSIESGRHYIVTNGEDKAMGAQNDNNRPAIGISILDGVATVSTADVREVVINGPDANGYYTIYDAEEPGYLYAVGGNSNNHLKTETFCQDHGRWTIEFDENTQAASVVANISGRNTMRYNSGSGIFSCYASGQADIYLYVKEDEDDVRTYVTDITADQWYLISSPVGTINLGTAQQPTNNVGNLTTGTYGLFTFDQEGDAQGKEWLNYKAGAFSQLKAGTGYLYINQGGCTLTFTGTPYDSNGIFQLVYSEANETESFHGLNLVGNPYAQSAAIDRNYYIMNADGTDLAAYTSDDIVPAMQGVFVQATEEGQNVTFTPNQSTTGGKGIEINLSQNRGTIVDRAIVRFGEGSQLSKVQLFENSTKLYIPQNGKDYAIVSTEAQGELPVNFRASENGTYTLSMDVENMDMNYLHLVDNMTGMDVDLLQTPSYTFEAKVNDYESRFRLVFAANNNNEDGPSTGSGTFAFYSNGNWIINNAGEATLQVVDLTGRILSSETVNGSVSKTINAVPGIYMLRLINGDNVNVQKIVVR